METIKNPTNNNETKESSKTPAEKHLSWLQESRVMVEGVGFVVVTSLAAWAIVDALGFHEPTFSTTIPAIVMVGEFMERRRKALRKKHD